MPKPQNGGCWICHEGNGWEDDDMAFDMEFDTFYHPDCLDEFGVDSILEYEQRSEPEHTVEFEVGD